MKYKLIIDPHQEEQIEIIAHSKNDKIIAIEKILQEENIIYGYLENEIVKIDINNVCCIYTQDSKVYVVFDNKQYQIKQRLYQLEEVLNNNFIKINQGCIINFEYIKMFENSIGGSVKVVLINGFEDYVSRRMLKSVKRSLGL